MKRLSLEKYRRGFTLIELVVVISIMGIISSIASCIFQTINKLTNQMEEIV